VVPGSRQSIQSEDIGLHNVDALDLPRVKGLTEAVEHRRSEIEALQGSRMETTLEQSLS